MSVISLARTSTRDSLSQRLVHLKLLDPTKQVDEFLTTESLAQALKHAVLRSDALKQFPDLIQCLKESGQSAEPFTDHKSLARGVVAKLYYELDEVITSTYRNGSRDDWEETVIGALENSIDFVLDDPMRLQFFRTAHRWPEFQYYSLEIGARVLKPISDYMDRLGIAASPQRKSVLCFTVRTAGALHQLVLSQADPKRREHYRQQSRLVLKRYLPGALLFRSKVQTDYA